jgi:hypothetical protein
MLRVAEKAMADWLSPERKRINEILSSASKTEPKIQKAARRDDVTFIDVVSESDRKVTESTIFEVIGTVAYSNIRPADDAAEPDLMGSLYEQYCRALDDPFASFSGNWSTPATVERASATIDDRVNQHGESIEAVISGVRGVEHFFGKLEAGNSPPAVMLEPVPEILHLFAPPEFKAHPGRLPSALVRREHHAPGIDSPLFAPRLASHSEAKS